MFAAIFFAGEGLKLTTGERVKRVRRRFPEPPAYADIEMTRQKAFPAILRLPDRATENRLSNCRGRPLGLCGQRLPELNLIPIQVIDPGKATVGFIHSFGVNRYSLLF